MKSWRTRIAVGLAAGAAAVAVPLTATNAVAADAPAADAPTADAPSAAAESGWVIAGGESYPKGEADCEQQARDDYFPSGYTDVDCVPNPEIRPDFYTIWIYHP